MNPITTKTIVEPLDIIPDSPTAQSSLTQITTDSSFMLRAIKQALMAKGNTYPNPLVGAIIVEDNEVVSEGFHAKAGGPHAERVALANLSRPPQRGAVLYVTLEPCSSYGRTEPCTDYLVAANFQRVVVGMIDPDPRHQGKGIDILRKAGIEVSVGVLEKECRDINSEYLYRVQRPQFGTS